MNAFPKDWQLADIHVIKNINLNITAQNTYQIIKINQTLPLQNKNNLLIRILKTKTLLTYFCSIRKHIFNLNLAHPSSI